MLHANQNSYVVDYLNVSRVIQCLMKRFIEA